MNTNLSHYPATPENVDEKITLPSEVFKKGVSKVLSSIFFFIVVYICLVIGAIILAIVAGYAGIALVSFITNLITIMICIGLLGLGFMVLFFLVKFIFKENTTDRSQLIEVRKKDQPELFAFIRKLTNEVGAPFPKKIYLSADVNASVFYDSSFWSMFLPVKKNLQIGLGLVNCINMSEFKAVLAHEFGHFSQRSMKLGSYVYNVNQIIHNLLYDNSEYGKTLEGWANISAYFHFFASLTSGIVEGIQQILQSMYRIINKNYMSLSQQMEFHADAVAASVTGSDHLITCLRRLEVADVCYRRLLEHYNAWVAQNLKSENLYEHHSEVLKHFAGEHKLPLENGLPKVKAGFFEQFNFRRIIVKDQWASHPSTDDREAHLKQFGIKAETMAVSAWAIFNNPQQLQQQMTEVVYEEAKFLSTPALVNAEDFRKKYFEETGRYKLNPAYKGFFDYRDFSALEFDPVNNAASLDEILSQEVLNLPKILLGINADLEMLKQSKAMHINSFEFDGKKYEKEDIRDVMTQLTKELEVKKKELIKADNRVVSFFLSRAQRQGKNEELKSRYQELANFAKDAVKVREQYLDIMSVVGPAYQGPLTYLQARDIDNKLKLKERPIKEHIRKAVENADFNNFLQTEQKDILKRYASQESDYFSNQKFNHEALGLFTESMNIYYAIFADRSFTMKKDLFDWQLQLEV